MLGKEEEKEDYGSLETYSSTVNYASNSDIHRVCQ